MVFKCFFPESNDLKHSFSYSFIYSLIELDLEI